MFASLTPAQVLEATAGLCLIVLCIGVYLIKQRFSKFNTPYFTPDGELDPTIEGGTVYQQEDWEHGDTPAKAWGTYDDVRKETGATLEHQALAHEVLAQLRADAEVIAEESDPGFVSPRKRFATARGVVPIPKLVRAPAGDPAHVDLSKFAQQEENMRHRKPTDVTNPEETVDPLDTTEPIVVDPSEPTPTAEEAWEALVASGVLTGIGADLDYEFKPWTDLYEAAGV